MSLRERFALIGPSVSLVARAVTGSFKARRQVPDDPAAPIVSDQVAAFGMRQRLAGHRLQVGDKAPDAPLTKIDGSSVRLSAYFGRPLVISTIPMIRTPVCNAQTRELDSACRVLDGITMLSISRDHPSILSQRRDAGVEHIELLSDLPSGAFGDAYGVQLASMDVLARALFVIAPDARILYMEICRDLATPADIAAAIAATGA